MLQDDLIEKAKWQAALGQEVENLDSEYNTLMYGGRSITQVCKTSQPPDTEVWNQTKRAILDSSSCHQCNQLPYATQI